MCTEHYTDRYEYTFEYNWIFLILEDLKLSTNVSTLVSKQTIEELVRVKYDDLLIR